MIPGISLPGLESLSPSATSGDITSGANYGRRGGIDNGPPTWVYVVGAVLLAVVVLRG